MGDEMFYVHEKLSNAVSTLATGSGRIKERLLDAFIGMHTLYGKQYDGDIGSGLTELFDRLTAVRATADEGDVAATINAMSENEAVELAYLIVRIDSQVDTYLREKDL